MLRSFLRGDPFPQGTLCAFLGLVFVSSYYLRARSKLRETLKLSAEHPPSDFSDGHPWPELRYLQVGAASSVALFLLAGAADAGHDWLERLVGTLMGLCGAVAAGIFGVGFVSLMNLWKELILQLKKASIGSLLVSIPLAILWLAMGFALLIGVGMVADRFANYFGALLRPSLWVVIALLFWGLWRGRSRALLMLRLILMLSFSAIILAAAAFTYWWVSSQTAPLLVLFLGLLAFLNVAFYSRFVRDTALMHNLVNL